MPKVGGNTIQECMSICMSDPKTIEEYPNTEKRSEVCYAACAGSMQSEDYFEISAQDGQYIIDGDANPILVIARGRSYDFEVDAEGHPFLIKTSQTTGREDMYEDGIRNNGVEQGTLVFEVPLNAPDLLYYNCEFHDTMSGEIEIVDEDQIALMELIQKYK